MFRKPSWDSSFAIRESVCPSDWLIELQLPVYTPGFSEENRFNESLHLNSYCQITTFLQVLLWSNIVPMQSNTVWPLDCSRSFQNDYEPVFLLLRSVKVRILISLGDSMIAKEQKSPLSLHLLTRKYLFKALQLLVKINMSILIYPLRFFELCSGMYNTISGHNGRMKSKQNTGIFFCCIFYYWRGYSINKPSQWHGLTCN